MPRLSSVSKAFDGKQVLSLFSLDINKGDRICLMGASGCGKTTVINLLLGLVAPDSGTVENPLKTSAVFQEDRLCEDFSALSNVRMVMPDGDTGRARELLCEAGLCDDLSRPVRELSGGMKRRVAICRALAADHDMLLLDEPFSGLDEHTKGEIAALINRYEADKTLVLVTHDPTDAELLSARVINLN